MLRILTIAAAVALLSGPSIAHDRASLVHVGGQLAQGHPYLVKQDGAVVVYPAPHTPLRYGVIEGRRVLLDPVTMRVVYYLHP